MKLKNKKILIHYVNVGNMDENLITNYLEEYREKYLSSTEKYTDLVQLVVPSRVKEGIESIQFAK
jgi:hypothetical protein